MQRRTIMLSIPGEPKGKGRPRFDGRNGRAYTPEATRTYEKSICIAYWQKYGRVVMFGSGPVDMRIVAYYGVPKSDSKSRRAEKLAGKVRPVKKPDMDNIVKIVADALNGYAYRDDAQVVGCRVEKYYSDTPRVEIAIREVGNDAETV